MMSEIKLDLKEQELIAEWKSKWDETTGRLTDGMELSNECYNYIKSHPPKPNFELMEDFIDKNNKEREALKKRYELELMLADSKPIELKDGTKILEKEYSSQEIEEAKKKLKECYHQIINLMKDYMEMKEENYKLIALWIIGTYVHKHFSTFPFLFINAMRGSGKTRLLKFIKALAKNGDIVADIREAVLFRTAKDHTIIIDEFEHVGSKDKSVLRELLNAGYKKGIKVKRMKKVFKDKGEQQIVEEFELYTPIAMANIWGMDEVLNDRCLTIILDKSNNSVITKVMEDFEDNVRFNNLQREIVKECIACMRKTSIDNLISSWNDYVRATLNIPYTTTLTTLPTLPYTPTQQQMFEKIFKTNIDGRNLELMFPLFILANEISEDIFEDILKIGKEIVDSKREEEFSESRDVSLIDFVSHQIQWRFNFVFMKTISSKFKEFIEYQQDNDDKWLNEVWVGKALKRLGLINKKQRKNKGVEVILEVDKAKEKIKMFKEVEDGKPNTK